MHSQSLNIALLVIRGMIGQINDGIDTECLKMFVIGFGWLGTAIKAIIHLAKVLDIDI